MTGRMTPERFREIEALFESVVGLDAPSRATRLDAIAEHDPALADAVRSLVAVDESGDEGARFEAGIGRVIDEVARGRSRIGPFRLERVIGAGGMGVVYEAVQNTPIQRRVALKLLHLVDGDEMRLRFRVEAQSLARLNHPNVAQVFEAGSGERGEPYLVMELIDGVPLTRYCSEHALSLRARIELLLAVCRGVQHAHQRGVVHRDLKPGNVLVTETDDGPTPKIIDFGIAKPLTPRVGPQAVTRAGEALGTLEYMSPEQTEGAGTADTRSDVYALGVLLYELLTGALPVPQALLSVGDLAAAMQAIRDHVPQRPSRCIEQVDAEVDRPVTARSVRGDLDWIALKALEKDPDRRYESVSELAADLERFLRGEAVQAGPPSATYRLRKLVWRHRWAVGTAAIVLTSLLVASIGLAVGVMRARAAEAAARVDAESARRVADFLVQIFEGADPRKGGAARTPVGDVVDRAAGTLGALQADPEVQSRLHQALGKVYANLGLFEPAQVQLERALAIRESQGGMASDAASLARAENLTALGSVLRRLDRQTESAHAYRRALALIEAMDAAPPLAHGEALNGLAVLLRRDAPDEAQALYTRSLALLESAFGAEHPNAVRVRVNLAALEARAGRHAAASDAFRTALALAERALPADDPDIAGMLGNYAFVERKLGRYRHSRDLLDRALALEHARLGADHPQSVYTRINLLAVCQRLGDLDAALEHGEAALRILAASVPADHHLLAIARSNHGATLMRLERWDEASTLGEAARNAVAGGDDAARQSSWVANTLLRANAERRAGRIDVSLVLVDEATAALGEPPAEAARRVEAFWTRAYALAAAARLDAGAAADAARQAARDAGIAAQPLEEARFAALIGDATGNSKALDQALATLPADAGWANDAELTGALDDARRADFAAAVMQRLQEEAPPPRPTATP